MTRTDFATRLAVPADNTKAARRRWRAFVLGVAATLVLSYAVWDMAIATRLLMGGGGAIPGITAYAMLYNGSTGDGTYNVGLATSADQGITWTPYAGNPVIAKGAGGTWNDVIVHAPALVWDGSQWVVYNDGYDGANWRIGRWTSSDLITWTPDAGNPLIHPGGFGAFDAVGVIGPTVLYEPTESPPWKMWYTGSAVGGAISLGYADSTDGISWTKRGQMLTAGPAGAFDDGGIGGAPAINVHGTYHLFATGYDGAAYHTGHVTTTNPASAATYTKLGVLSAFSGNLSFSDGYTYQSNQLRPIISTPGGYIGFGTSFGPTADPPREITWRSTSTDLVNWTTPVGPLIALGSGWDSISAENPSVVENP